MFSGEERTSVVSTMTDDEFDDCVCRALDRLGSVEVNSDGDLDIRPSGSLVSFFSTISFRGRVSKTDDGYRVSVQYTLAPSAACWVLGVVLFCLVFMVGGAIIFVPAIEKSGVATTVANALRDLKEEAGGKGGRSRRSRREER